MNNAKMWLVVNPTVGVPLFLGAVAIGSFSVHVAVLSNTTWVSDFLSGRKATASAAIELPVTADPKAATVYFDGQAKSGDEAVVVLADGRKARVVFEDKIASTTLADASITAK